MARVVKKGLLVLMLFAVVWLAVIIWWQESRTLPTGVDIGLYLFALPLAMLAALWLGARAVRAARAPKPAADPATPTAQTPAHAPAQLAQLRVAAVAARAAAGDDTAAIAEALAAQKRPELDAELKTPQGYPIFAARVPGVNDLALYAAARERGAPPEATGTAPLRVTSLLADVARTLTNEAHRHVTALDVPARDEDWPLLRVELVLPADWPDAARERACQEIQTAAGVWPDSRIGVAQHQARDTMAADGLLRDLAAAAHDAQTPEPWRIVLAGDGYIDPEQVAMWDGMSTLLTPANPQGRVPGEAAAGLLLGPAGTDAPLRVALSPVLRRQKPADARGAQAEAPLAQTVQDLLQRADVAPDSVIHVISDADHRGSRPLEPVNIASQLFSHLDAAKDCQSVGVACGHTGVAASLLTLAVAGQACMQYAQPVLTLTLQDPVLRSAALVSQPAAGATA